MKYLTNGLRFVQKDNEFSTEKSNSLNYSIS